MKNQYCRIRILATCVLLALLGCLTVAGEQQRAQHVFIVSFDQGNPDLIKQSDMPTVHRMMRQGAQAQEAFTIVPSSTLPSHASMVTGVGIQKHQVLWNSYKPEKGIVKPPTIFKLAKQRGLVTAMFVSKEKFKHLNQLGSLDSFVWPQPDDDAKSVARAFAEKVAELKPNLCLIHFRDPDTTGHEYGAYAPEKVLALRDCDEGLKIIQDAIDAAGILDQSVIILTADHGSHSIENKEGKIVGTHGSAQSEDVLIPWIAWGKGVKQGATITSPVVQYDTAATALWLLGVPLPEHFWGRPVTSAFEYSSECSVPTDRSTALRGCPAESLHEQH